MSDGKPQVLILSSVDWDAAWQRHHAFAELWARSGHRVFFVENTGTREPGLQDLGRVFSRLGRLLKHPDRASVPAGIEIVSPMVLPPTRPLYRWINSLLLLSHLADDLQDRGLRPGAVAFAYLPTATTLGLLDRLAPSLVVYDCVDNFRGLAAPPPDIETGEAALMARCGLVLTTSRTLFTDKKDLHANVVELHHGVGPAFFLPPRPPGPIRRLCYFGTLWHAVDYAPIRALAEAGFEVELIGPAKEPPPRLPASVRLRGPVSHQELPQVLSGFDALLLPYVDDEYNRGVIPAKTYECLATGRPVLASPIPALAGLSDVLTVCRTPADWVAAARDGERRDSPAARAARIASARAHTEEAAFARLRALAADARRAAPAPAAAFPRSATLLSGLGWIGLLYTAAKAAALFTQFLAGRLLGPEEFGRANLAVAAAAYLQIVPMLGFPLATSKLVSDEVDEERRARLISTALAAFLLWAVLSFPVMAAAHRFLENALGVPPALFLLSALLAFATALGQVLASPLLGLKRFAQRGLTETIYGFAFPLLLLGSIALLGPTHQTMIYALSGSLLASSTYALWSIRRYLTPSFDRTFLASVGRYAVTATLMLLATACLIAPARLFLNRHAGAQDVGLFSAYFTTTVQVALAFLYMLQAVLVPMASGAGQREIWALFRRRAAPGALAAWCFFALTATAGLAVFGRRYPFDLAWAATFAAAAACVLVNGAASALYAARDFSGLRVSVAGTVTAGLGNVALTAFLVPRHGVPGAAVSLAASSLIGLAFYGLVSLWERRRAG